MEHYEVMDVMGRLRAAALELRLKVLGLAPREWNGLRRISLSIEVTSTNNLSSDNGAILLHFPGPLAPSAALALEYEDVLLRSKPGLAEGEQARKAIQALLARAEYVPIRFTYRPASPDPSDDLVVDCVLNSQSLLVTNNVKDFRRPAEELGFKIRRPPEFLELLRKEVVP